ncbi:MAG: CotH kinase family protein, partial [Verrucomicrobiota bacterium]
MKNGSGKIVDSVEYSDRAPWPVSPDGYSASLERIDPERPANLPSNWAASALTPFFERRPAGTPGAVNSVFRQGPIPLFSNGSASAEGTVAPDQPVEVEWKVEGAETVALLYQVVQPGIPGEEKEVPMQEVGEGRFRGTIPGQAGHRLVRYRVRATAADGGDSYWPHPNAIRPARSIYVAEPAPVGAVPVIHLFHTGAEESADGKNYRTSVRSQRGGNRFGGGRRRLTEAERARMELEASLRPEALATVWSATTMRDDFSAEKCRKVRPLFVDALAELTKMEEALAVAEEGESDVVSAMKDRVAGLGNRLREQSEPILTKTELAAFAAFGRPVERRGRRGWDSMAQALMNLEQRWFEVAMNDQVDSEAMERARGVFIRTAEERGRKLVFPEGRRGRPDFEKIMEGVGELGEGFARDLTGALGSELMAEAGISAALENPFGGRRNRGGRGDSASGTGSRLRAQGRSALIHTAPDGTCRVYDFVNVSPRKSGYKVKLQKDRPHDGMTTINLLYEPGDRTILNEALAYDLYRAAGNASQRAGYVRLLIDGALAGFHLWFEQPNGAFFRHNEIDDDGNLYKLIWQGGNEASPYTPDAKKPKRPEIVNRHEKKTHPHDGYEDLERMIGALEKADGDDKAMWQTIEEHFDVDQVVNYFAVNSLLSHWDGFFNNYFL